jgi:cytosine deaminase
LLGSSRNRQYEDDAASACRDNAFHNAGQQRSYRNTVMVTTLSPCWYWAGLVRQFGIRPVVVGDETRLSSMAGFGWPSWCRHHRDQRPGSHLRLMGEFTIEHPALWNEDRRGLKLDPHGAADSAQVSLRPSTLERAHSEGPIGQYRVSIA